MFPGRIQDEKEWSMTLFGKRLFGEVDDYNMKAPVFGSVGEALLLSTMLVIGGIWHLVTFKWLEKVATAKAN